MDTEQEITAISMDTEQEITAISTEIAAHPDDPTLYTKRGKLYASLKRYDEAIADYDHAITLNPNYARAYTNRANAYTATGRFVEALRDVEKALSLLASLHYSGWLSFASNCRALGRNLDSYYR